MGEISDETRAELERVTREGLEQLGASEEEIAHALEPGISPDEMKVRIQAAIDARIHAGLAAAGMSKEERDAALDTSGTPEEQQKRREGVAMAMLARKIVAEDPERARRVAAFEATVAEAKRQHRSRMLTVRIGVAVMFVATVAIGLYLYTRPNACDALLGTDEELGSALGMTVKREKTSASKYSCMAFVRDTSGRLVLLVNVEGARQYASNEYQMKHEGFDSVAPLDSGDQAELGIIEHQGEKKLETKDVLAARSRGSKDPVGDALSAMGPPGQTVIARGKHGSVRIIVYGTPELADKTVRWIKPRFAAVANSRYD